MAYQISFPENLFNRTHQEIGVLKNKLAGISFSIEAEKEMMKESGRNTSGELNFLKKSYGLTKQDLAKKKHFMDSYWDYTLLRSFNKQICFFKNRGINAKFAEFLNLDVREIKRKKARIIKFGFAKITGKNLIFLSQDKVWAKFGVLIAERKKDENGKRIAHQTLGVYSLGKKGKILRIKKGTILKKSGRPALKDLEYTNFKRFNVKVLKFTAAKHELKINKLKVLAGLACYKWYADKIASKPKTKETDQRKNDSDVSMKITCKKISRKVGNVSDASGYWLRKELEDCGFIDVTVNKFKQTDQIEYDIAKEQFPLQQGIQEESGLAYFFSKKDKTVYGVSCYDIHVNGYVPIDYNLNKVKKPKKERKRYVMWHIQQLMDVDGFHIKKIWRDYEFLFSIDSIKDYLNDLFCSEDGDGIFSFEKFSLRANLDQALEEVNHIHLIGSQ